jgi:hypothetical protein
VVQVLSRMLDGLATSYAAFAASNGWPTSATYGRSFGVSSATADLQRSLESRLRLRMEESGSRLFEHRWKSLVMPLGEPILQRRALERRTSGKGCTSWPTPNAQDSRDGETMRREAIGSHAMSLHHKAVMTGWPTPQKWDGEGGGQAKRAGNPERSNDLGDFVMLTGWTSPTAVDGRRGMLPPRPTDTGVPLSQQAPLASWPTATSEDSQCVGPRRWKSDNLSAAAKATGWTTPSATDGERAGKMTPNMSGSSLTQMVAMAGWSTTSARDWKDSAEMSKTGTNPDGTERTRIDQLPRQASLTVSGETRIGYSARSGIVTLGSGAQLNPAHSRWLQGLPEIFCETAIRAHRSLKQKTRRKQECSGSEATETQSSPKSRRRSSKPISKREPLRGGTRTVIAEGRISHI